MNTFLTNIQKISEKVLFGHIYLTVTLQRQYIQGTMILRLEKRVQIRQNLGAQFNPSCINVTTTIHECVDESRKKSLHKVYQSKYIFTNYLFDINYFATI